MTLKELRSSMGLSQREFGQRIGVPHSRVATWETGRERVPVVHRDAIAMSVGRIDIDWDAGYVGRPSPARRVRYRVRGWTGERDDRQEWWLSGEFVTVEQAQELALRLNTWCSMHQLHTHSEHLPSWAVRDRARCPHDPEFVCDYTGTAYEVVPVLMAPVARGGSRYRAK